MDSSRIAQWSCLKLEVVPNRQALGTRNCSLMWIALVHSVFHSLWKRNQCSPKRISTPFNQRKSFKAILCGVQLDLDRQSESRGQDQVKLQRSPWMSPMHHLFPYKCWISCGHPWWLCACMSQYVAEIGGLAWWGYHSMFQSGQRTALYGFSPCRRLSRSSCQPLVGWM